MSLCFPKKDKTWINKQTKAFYSNLADVIIESIEGFSMTAAQAKARVQIENPEVLSQLFDRNKSVLITGGHYVSWEAMTQATHLIPHKLFALYKPLNNSFMDGKMRLSRAQFGMEMIPMRDYKPYFVDLEKEPKAFVFGIDQSPQKGRGIWMNFLNRETLVYTGPERISKEYNLALVAGRMTRKGRGKYSLKFKLITDSPRETRDHEITHATMKDIEGQITEGPSGWLWSHNRWKHKREDGN